MKLVRELIEHGEKAPNDLYEGVQETYWMHEIHDFYTDACRRADDGPSYEALEILCRPSNKDAKTRAAIIVHDVDKLYFKAGWSLKPGETGVNPEIPIRISHSSASPRRRRVENNLTLSPLPNQPNQRSQSGTPHSVKFSKQRSAQHILPSAAANSRTSFSQSQPSARFLCFCGTQSDSLKEWKRHDDTHFPLHFYACVYKNCDFVTGRPETADAHYKSCTKRRGAFTNNELGHNEVRQKFSIPDRGHERCIYGCDVVFGGNGKMSKDHMVYHQKTHTFEELHRRLDHQASCSGNCGGKGYWKTSEYVVDRQRRVSIADKDNDGTDASDGDDGSGSGGRSGDEGGQQGDHNSSRMTAPKEGRSNRKSNDHHGDSNARRRTIGEHFGYISPYTSRRSAMDHQATAVADRTDDFVQNTYAVTGEHVPTWPTVDARKNHMAARIEDMAAPLHTHGGMLDGVLPSPSVDAVQRRLRADLDLEYMEAVMGPPTEVGHYDMRMLEDAMNGTHGMD